MNIWKKVSGEWLVFVARDGATPQTGSTVGVFTRSTGQTKMVALGELVSSDGNGWLFKVAPRNAEPRPAERPVATVGNLSGVMALFETARSHLRRPAIVIGVPAINETVKLTVAAAHHRVPGSINVVSETRRDDRYGKPLWYGRIHTDGRYEQREVNEAVAARLAAFATNPAAVAAEHGRLTGRCCFCNRHLEDERSTAVGYGPVCADHFGLPWGERPTDFAAPVAGAYVAPPPTTGTAPVGMVASRFTGPVPEGLNGEDDGLVLRR